MKKNLLAAVALTGLAAPALVAAPAQAGPTVTVSSSSCGRVVITNSSAGSVDVVFDNGGEDTVAARSSRVETAVPSGRYAWAAYGGAGSATYGTVTVKGCAGNPTRPVAGDFDGDGIADVVGVQASTGDLYSYRTYPQGLASIGVTGRGWGGIGWMQRVADWSVPGMPGRLLAMRTDGTLWAYEDLGGGHFQSGVQVGSGWAGYTNVAVLPTNNKIAVGVNVLLASKGDTLYASPIVNGKPMTPQPLATGWSAVKQTIALRDFDGDGFADIITIRTDGSMWVQTVDPNSGTGLTTARQIGSGWGQMETVVSPGSLDGDARSDLVARRSDGNLYRYTSLGSTWSPYVRIGVNWQGVRLLG